MHIHKAVSLALTLGFLVPTAARADTAAVRKQIEAQMDRFQQAFRRKDIAALRTITTSDFTMKTADGQVATRREAETAMAREMKSIAAVKEWTLKVEKIAVKGDVATLVVSERMAAQLTGGFGKDQVTVSNTRMRETWVKSAGSWRYKRAEALSSTTGTEGMSFVTPVKLDARRPGYTAARKAIEAQYEAYKRAIRAKNYSAALSTMAADVTTIYPNGRTFNRREMEAALRQTVGATRSIPEWELKILRMSYAGNSAIVSVGERMVSTYGDFRGLHKQTLVDFYRDTWVRTSKGWKLRNTQVLQGTATVDGRTGNPFK